MIMPVAIATVLLTSVSFFFFFSNKIEVHVWRSVTSAHQRLLSHHDIPLLVEDPTATQASCNCHSTSNLGCQFFCLILTKQKCTYGAPSLPPTRDYCPITTYPYWQRILPHLCRDRSLGFTTCGRYYAYVQPQSEMKLGRGLWGLAPHVVPVVFFGMLRVLRYRVLYQVLFH